jgi:hypothetical protein
VLQAKYLLDRLDGDTDKDPTKPDSCALVTQRYEFWREGLDAPETSDELSAARFKPIVSYQYFTDSGPAIQSFNAAQRFQFAPTQFQFNGAATPPSFSYPASASEIATFFLDCELGDISSHLGCINFITDIDHLGTTTPDGNPMPTEIATEVIANGQPVPPIGRTDNLHLRSYLDSAGHGGTQIEGPTTTGHPGCPECVHMHWRWGSILTRDNPIGGLVASPRFKNYDGNPIIPAGSNQDVDIGILVANIGGGPGSEEHPSFLQTYLDFATGKSINSQQPLSVWYSATGHSAQDTFMTHGGFFSSLRVSISNPYIFTTSALIPLPLQTFVACPTSVQVSGMCPISSDIQNRTGHTLNWTATIIDQASRAVVASSGPPAPISGTPGAQTLGKASVYLPAGTQLLPTYILDIKVVDAVTGWSTERQAYVTASTVGLLAVPLL